MTNDETYNSALVDVVGVSEKLRIRPHIYVKLVKSFVANLNGKLRMLGDAISTDDRDQMRMTLHEIKGTAGNLRLGNIIGPEMVLHAAVKAGASQRELAAHFEILRHEAEKLQQYVCRIPDDLGGDNA